MPSRPDALGGDVLFLIRARATAPTRWRPRAVALGRIQNRTSPGVGVSRCPRGLMLWVATFCSWYARGRRPALTPSRRGARAYPEQNVTKPWA